MKEILKKIRPDKSYGQNFLVDKNILQKIVAAGEITSTDCILEIGAGQGVLTAELVRLAGRVVSYEIDSRLFGILQEKFLGRENLILKHLDILKSEPEELPCDRYKIIANIPYNITSKILEKFLTAPIKPQAMVLLVQKELAERICASPGDTSFLSVLVQYFGCPEILQIVHPSSFNPPPKVASAILKISRITSPLPPDQERAFFRLVKVGFSQKRKMLKKNLKSVWQEGQVAEAFRQSGLNETARAEDLSPEQWRSLAKILT